MEFEGLDRELKSVHIALNTPHLWIFLSRQELTRVDSSISKHRQVCSICGKVQWYMDFNGAAENGWRDDESALATEAIHIILKRRNHALAN